MQSKSKFTEAQCARLLRRLASRVKTLQNLLQVAPSYIKSPSSKSHRQGAGSRRNPGDSEFTFRTILAPNPENDDDADDVFQRQPRSKVRVQYSKNARKNKAAQADGLKSKLAEPIPKEFWVGQGSVHECMEKCLKPLVHKEVYAAVRGIVAQIEDIIVETKRKPPSEPATLAEMIAASIGKYAATCELEDEVDMLRKEVTSYGQSAYLKALLRGQAIGMIGDVIEDGLFRECAAENRAIVEGRIVGILVKSLLEKEAYAEAVDLVQTMIQTESAETRPLFEIVLNCFTDAKLRDMASQPDLSNPHKIAINSLQLHLSTELLESSYSRAFLSSSSLCDILEECLLTHAMYPASEYPQYFSNVNEFMTTYLLMAFGLQPKKPVLAHSDEFLERQQRYHKKSSRKPVKKPANTEVKPLNYHQQEKAERILMLVVVALVGGSLFRPQATGKIYSMITEQETDFPRQECSLSALMVAKLATYFVHQDLPEVKNSERLWGQKVLYPLEAKSLILFRYLSAGLKPYLSEKEFGSSEILERVYQSIKPLDAVKRVESAQHIVNCIENQPRLFHGISVQTIVDLILQYINGGLITPSDPSALPQTPVRPSLLTDARYTVLATFAVEMALQCVEVEPDAAKKENLIVWADDIQKQVMNLGLYTPAKPKKQKSNAGLPWQRPAPELSVNSRRHGYQFMDGIGEWIAVGGAQHGERNGSPSRHVRRQKVPISYKERSVTPSSQIVVSDLDDDEEMGEGSGTEVAGTDDEEMVEDEEATDDDLLRQQLRSEHGDVIYLEGEESDDAQGGEERMEEDTESEDTGDSATDSVIMSPLFESARDDFSASSSDFSASANSDVSQPNTSQISTFSTRQIACAVVITKRPPFSLPPQIDPSRTLPEPFSPRRKRPNNTIKVVVPPSPTFRKPTLRKRISLPASLPSRTATLLDDDLNHDDLITTTTRRTRPPQKRRASDLFDKDDINDPEYQLSSRSRPRKKRSASVETDAEFCPYSKRYQRELAKKEVSTRRSSGNASGGRRVSAASSSSARTRGRKRLMELSEDELSFC